MNASPAGFPEYLCWRSEWSSFAGLFRCWALRACSLSYEALYLCLQRWTALQLAVQNEWGGPSSVLKCQQLHSDLLSFFIKSKERRYIDELEDLLDQCMLDFFNTEIEDGSLVEVAEQIMTMHEECMLGNFDNVRFIATPAPGSGQSLLDSKQMSGTDDEVETIIGNEQAGISRVEAEGMDVEVSLPSAVHPSSSAPKIAQVPQLTEEDTAEGWQHVPARKGLCTKI